MAWLPLSPSTIADTLAYFDRFDYPLTLAEIKYWFNPSSTASHKPYSHIGRYYFLRGRSQLVALRRQRAKYSRAKWAMAKRVGEALKKFPTIAAVFVTGALAMNNSPAADDIDLMIVTSPNTLWITRFFLLVYLDLVGVGRHPDQKAGSVCLNLWLDTNHLAIRDHDLYHAHEVLQAKPLWDRAGVHAQFLRANSWASRYLPVAYKSQTSNLKIQKIQNWDLGFGIWDLISWSLNLLFFLPQYLYRWPHKTSGRLGPGFAFFHPRPFSV